MKSYLFLPLMLLSLVFSCNEKVLSAGNDLLKIKDAFTQKEVPGQSGLETKDYLNIFLDLKNPASTQISEVIFKGKSYAVTNKLTRLKLDISGGADSNKKESLKDNEAKIFYTVDNKNYALTIKNIVTKPTVYLP